MEKLIPTNEIIEDFGSIENFKEVYIQALINNTPIDRLDEKTRKYVDKYRDIIVIGFDMSQPNLIASPEIVSATLDVRDSWVNRTIGNFYNQQDAEELIDCWFEDMKSADTKNDIFRYLYGIGRQKKTKEEIADLLGLDNSKMKAILNTHYMISLRKSITSKENERIDENGRNKFIKAYFEKNGIFRTEIEMSKEEQDELIELYNREVCRIEEEKTRIESRKLEKFNLSTRTFNMLVRAGYTTIDELLEHEDEGKLLEIKGFGSKGIEEVREILAKERGEILIEEKDERNLSNFNLLSRTRTALLKAGYRTIDDLLDIEYESELGNIHGIGDKHSAQIIEMLSEQGYRLKSPEEEQKEKKERELENLLQELYSAYDELSAIQDKCKKLEEQLSRRGVNISQRDTDDNAR